MRRSLRFLLPFTVLGILSCQEEPTTAPQADTIRMVPVLRTESGGPIPTADSLRFRIRVGDQAWLDTTVDFKRKELDLGTVHVGDSIRWQAIGYTWNSGKTTRSVVWASQMRKTVAVPDGNRTAFDLETPVVAGSFAAPSAALAGFAASSANVVTLADSDTAFRFAFSAAGTDSVYIDGARVVDSSGIYSKIYRVAIGSSTTVSLRLRDTLGAISVLAYTLQRPGTQVVPDSSIAVLFVSPSEDGPVDSSTGSIPVTVKVSSKLHVDSVRIATHDLVRTDFDSTLWTASGIPLSTGTNVLRAVAFAGALRDTGTRTLVRMTPTSVSVSFVSPANDTEVAHSASSLGVKVRTVSKLAIEKVWLGSDSLLRDASSGTDTILWTGTAALAVGHDSLRAVAIVGGQRKDSAVRVVTRAQDSGVTVRFRTPAADGNVPFSDSTVPVEVVVTTKVGIDTILLPGDTLRKTASWAGTDSSLWIGNAHLAVGTNTLVATARRGGIGAGSATRILARAPDSSISVVIAEPVADSVFPAGTTSTAVEVHVTTRLHGFSVDLGGTALAPNSDSTIWTASSIPLAPGRDTLRAIARSGLLRDTATTIVTVQTDNSIAVSFAVPGGDTSVPNATRDLPVTVKVVSRLAIGSVTVRGIALSQSSTTPTNWTGSVPLAVGTDVLRATAISGSFKDSSLPLTATRRDTVPKPRFSPPSSTILAGQSVAISAGSGDTVETSWQGGAWTRLSGGSFTPPASGTLRVRAFGSLTDTSMDSATYVVQTKAPLFQTQTDTGSSSFKVGILPGTTGASIFVSLDGGPWIPYPSDSITVSGPTTIRAYDSLPGMSRSSVDSSPYTLRCPKPRFQLDLSYTLYGITHDTATSPNGGTLDWSLDNGTWTSSPSPTDVRIPVGSHTVKAVAHAAGWARSDTTARSYSIQAAPVPEFQYTSGTVLLGPKTVLIWCTASSYELKYSLDGAGGPWQDYPAAGVQIAHSDTLYAIAFLEGDTVRSSASYVVRAPAAIISDIQGPGYDSLSFSSGLSGVTFQYDLGTAGNWTAYNKSFRTTYTGTLRVKSQCTGCVDSIVSYTLARATQGIYQDPRDNQNYSWRQISTQYWMSQNLNYHPTGDTGSWCYMDQVSNCTDFGAMYSWAGAMGIDSNYNHTVAGLGTTKRKGICPTGWHLPSEAEWDQLIAYFSSYPGSALKTTSGWILNGNGYDSKGFAAMPAGDIQDVNKDIYTVSANRSGWTWFWTTGESDATNGMTRSMRYDSTGVLTVAMPKNWGVSVRCLAD